MASSRVVVPCLVVGGGIVASSCTVADGVVVVAASVAVVHCSIVGSGAVASSATAIASTAVPSFEDLESTNTNSFFIFAWEHVYYKLFGYSGYIVSWDQQKEIFTSTNIHPCNLHTDVAMFFSQSSSGIHPWSPTFLPMRVKKTPYLFRAL